MSLKSIRGDSKRIAIDNCHNTAMMEIIDHIEYESVKMVFPAAVVIQFDNNNKIQVREDFSDSAVFLNAMHKSWIPKK